MPTCIAQCQPTWLPTGSDPQKLATIEQSTSYQMGLWLVECLPDIINDVHGRCGDSTISPDTVWCDFRPMSGVAINAAQVLLIARPPEVYDTSEVGRKKRRRDIATRVKDHLLQELRANLDHLHVPRWEIEVIPEHTSGFGVTQQLDVAYSW